MGRPRPAVMMVCIRSILACVALLAALTASGPQTPAKAMPVGEEPQATIEVRLRKLHLVRPDLIPYPIAYEVVC